MLRLRVTAIVFSTVLLYVAASPAEEASGPALCAASHEGEMDKVKTLLNDGADINFKDADGWTPLIHAAWKGRTETVLFLLARGADVNLTNKKDESAIVKAGQRGFTDIIQLLQNAGAKKTTIFLNHGDYPESELTAAQRWALATVAVSNQQSGNCHNLLGGEPLTPQTRVDAILGLKDWWGITDRKEAVEVLEWLLNEGHHREFEQLAALVSTLSDKEYERILAKYDDNPEVIFKLKFARENQQKLGDKSLLAWDLCRYIQVVELCFMAGYMSEEESWEKIMPAARVIQQHFSSWSDMGENYLAGRNYWAAQRNKRLAFIYSLLINDKDEHSPWTSTRWNTDLSDAPKAQAPVPGETSKLETP